MSTFDTVFGYNIPFHITTERLKNKNRIIFLFNFTEIAWKATISFDLKFTR